MRINKLAVVTAAVTLCVSTLSGQIGGGPAGGGFPGGGRGRPGGAPQANLPDMPTAVPLPTLSAEVTGPGPMFDSSPSLWPGKGLAAFNYETHEYFVSGTANGEPYWSIRSSRMVPEPKQETTSAAASVSASIGPTQCVAYHIGGSPGQ